MSLSWQGCITSEALQKLSFPELAGNLKKQLQHLQSSFDTSYRSVKGAGRHLIGHVQQLKLQVQETACMLFETEVTQLTLLAEYHKIQQQLCSNPYKYTPGSSSAACDAVAGAATPTGLEGAWQVGGCMAALSQSESLLPAVI
jgi:hypothetical protein